MGASTETMMLHSLAKRWFSVAFSVFSVFLSSAHAEFSATDRVIQFLTNAHTGVSMSAPDWIDQEMQSAPAFRGFGGIERLVEQSTRSAHEYGGLKTVRILKVVAKDGQILVRAEVAFFDDARRRKSPSNAERGNMIWNFQVKKFGPSWMLKF